jgi:hypothetical protein
MLKVSAVVVVSQAHRANYSQLKEQYLKKTIPLLARKQDAEVIK